MPSPSSCSKHLEEEFANLTYRSLVDRIGSSILQLGETNAGYRDQTPQLEGNGNMVVFGGGLEKQPPALIATPMAGGNVQLSSGSSVGLTVGTIVALYPPGALDLQDPSEQLGVITLSKVAADGAVGQLVKGTDAGKLSAGMRAIVVRPGSTKVRAGSPSATGPGLDALKEAIAKAGHDGKGSPYLVVVEPKHQEEFSVVVEKGTYQIRDNHDDPLPRISPPVSVKEPGAAKKMVQRLEHLVQYRNAWELTNDVDSSDLGDKLAISVVRKASRAAGKIAPPSGREHRHRHPQPIETPPERGPVLLRAGLERHADLARRGDRLPGAGRHRRRGVLGLERDGGAPRGRFPLDRAAQALRHRQADELRRAVARLARRHSQREAIDRR